MITKYNEAMEYIEVTADMRSRILKNIENIDFTEEKKVQVVYFPNIKRVTMLAACLVILVVGVFNFSNQHFFSNPVDIGNSGIVEVSSVEELSEVVGFEVIELESLPFEAKKIVYTAYWTDLAEITYTNNEQIAVFRKGIGSDDISGDYNSYEVIDEILVESINVTLKGNEETYTLATWTDGEYAYSLSLSEGISKMEYIRIIETMIE